MTFLLRFLRLPISLPLEENQCNWQTKVILLICLELLRRPAPEVIGNSRNLKKGKNGRRAAQRGEATCDEPPRRCSNRECRDASWGADEVSAPQFCWNNLRARQLCWRLNRPCGALSLPGVVEGFAFGWPEVGCCGTSGLTGCAEG